MTTRSVTDLFDDTKPPKSGYVVFALEKYFPTVVHATREDAVREAERLALDRNVDRLIVCEVTDVVSREVLANRRSLTDGARVTSWMDADGADDDDDSVCACAEPDDDGWVPHDGGPCPVNPGTKVDVKFRNGAYSSKCDEAQHWYWRHDCSDCDIIAYKVVSE